MTEGRGGIARAAVLLSVLAAVSALFGLVRDIVIAGRFGASADLDAYLVAQGLLNVVLGLLAGAMAKATVPVVSRGVSRGDVPGAHLSAVVALSVTTVVLGLASILTWLAAAPLMDTVAPGFDGGERDLAVRLTRVVVFASVFIAGTNLLAAVAQAHRRFFWSGVQGVPFNVVMIVAAVVFGPRYGVMALAVGYVAASGARLLAQLVPVRSIGLRLRPSFAIGNRGFREILRLVPALLVGSAIGNVNTLVDRAVGSTVGEGTISALNYGWRVAAVAELLLIVPLVTALYPSLGAAATGPALAGLLQRGLSTMAVVLTPVAVTLVVVARPVVTVVFGRGSFGPNDVERTATALAWYAPAIVALGWREVVARAFYSAGDARTPVIVAGCAMVLNVVGDVTIGRQFGVAGLALSTTLSIALAATLNTVQAVRLRQTVDTAETLRMLARVTGAAAAGAVLALLVVNHLDIAGGTGGWAASAEALLGAACVLAGFVGTLAVVRAPELATLRSTARSMLGRGQAVTPVDR